MKDLTGPGLRDTRMVFYALAAKSRCTERVQHAVRFRRCCRRLNRCLWNERNCRPGGHSPRPLTQLTPLHRFCRPPPRASSHSHTHAPPLAHLNLHSTLIILCAAPRKGDRHPTTKSGHSIQLAGGLEVQRSRPRGPRNWRVDSRAPLGPLAQGLWALSSTIGPFNVHSGKFKPQNKTIGTSRVYLGYSGRSKE